MPDPSPLPDEVRALLDRSNRLGSDPTVTNYGGGNTSAKVTVTSPASGEPRWSCCTSRGPVATSAP